MATCSSSTAGALGRKKHQEGGELRRARHLRLLQDFFQTMALFMMVVFLYYSALVDDDNFEFREARHRVLVCAVILA